MCPHPGRPRSGGGNDRRWPWHRIRRCHGSYHHRTAPRHTAFAEQLVAIMRGFPFLDGEAGLACFPSSCGTAGVQTASFLSRDPSAGSAATEDGTDDACKCAEGGALSSFHFLLSGPRSARPVPGRRDAITPSCRLSPYRHAWQRPQPTRCGQGDTARRPEPLAASQPPRRGSRWDMASRASITVRTFVAGMRSV